MQETNQPKIREIQEKKKKLRDRILKLESVPNDSSNVSSIQNKNSNSYVPTYEEKMAELIEKKKKLEQQKQKQFRYKKMQEQYIERRKQAQREKRLEQIKNEKKMIQLEAGMKRIVFEGIKEKVRGVNSEQLMVRAMFRDQAQEKPRGYTSKGNVRQDFQQFLEAQQKRDLKQKWDIYQLNEKRLQIFEKKEETLMKQILLKQMIALGKQEQQNVLEMNRAQLEDKLEQYGLSIDEYIQNISKEDMIEAVPQIQQTSIERIQQYKRQKKWEEEQLKELQRLKAKNKEQLLLMPSQTVKMMRSLIYRIIDAIVFDYQKRLNRFEISQIATLRSDLEERHRNILLETEDYEYSKIMTLQILEKIHQEFFIQAAEEMAKLNNFSHDRTQECFAWMFETGTNIAKKFDDIENLNIPMNFQSDIQAPQAPKKSQKNQLKKQNYLSKFQDYTSNSFDVDKLTTELINEVNLLEGENRYFNNISIKIYNQKNAPDGLFQLFYDRQLYIVSNEGVFNSRKTKKLQPLGINDKLQILRCDKFHNFWIIHDNQKVSLYSFWGLEVLQNQIGDRISSMSGKISSFAIFPVFTFSGGICALVLGFQKGQVLKYNFNLNRIDNTQTNISTYVPILPQVKTGDEPPFPLNKDKVIPVKNKKLEANQQIHEFRQFFDHHTAPIIGIVFHRFNSFITVDKTLKCAIWIYDQREGAKCYKPAYTFQFVCSYYVYREAQNSRYSEIYPSGKGLKQKPAELYEKWMQTEGYLKKQIYNNPKTQTAYFRIKDLTEDKGQMPIWKINYDSASQKVLKINESYYNPMSGKMEGKFVKLWRQYILIMCEREHPIRDDLKTMKIYGWDYQEKKMRSIGIQFDIYKSQKSTQFQILDNMLVGVDMHLLAVVSSGRVLVFSLLSGQLLRNISDPLYLLNPKFSSAFFTQIVSKRSYLAASTKSLIVEISFNDRNSFNEQKQLNEIIQEAQKKYINLL